MEDFTKVVRSSSMNFRLAIFVLIMILGAVFASCKNPWMDDILEPLFPTVTFNSNGGSAVASVKVAKGTQIPAPQFPPVRTDHIFDGWYTEPGFINKVDFPYTVTVAITLYAKWNTASSILLSAPGLDNNAYTFQGADFGYADQDVLTVTVTNVQNKPTGDLEVKLLGTHQSSFILSTGTLASLDPGSNRIFSVRPNSGLVAGTYKATVTVSGEDDISESFAVSFTVSPAPIANAAVIVTAPSRDDVPDTTADITTANPNFTVGSVTWTPDDNPFDGGIQYTVSITLTANANYTFTGGLTATINENPVTPTNNTGSGSTVVLAYEFAATLVKDVTGIVIQTQPSLDYTHGDTLNLSALVVTLTYEDDTTENVAFANFAAKGITASPANGTPLVRSTHNGEPVEVSVGVGGLSVNTNDLTVAQADPVDKWPTNLTATYGQTLSNITLPGNGTSKTAGTFSWTAGGTTSVGDAGSRTHNMTFTPTDTTNYSTVTQDVTVTVDKATPTVNWPTTGQLTATFEETLSDITLPANNGTGTPGTFSWTTTSVTTTTVGSVGYRQHNMTFRPDDTDNYNTATYNVLIEVNPKAITSAAITVTAPAKDATPTTTASGGAVNFTTAITWSSTDGTLSGDFRANRAYTATVTLTAGGNYTFPTGFTATINGDDTTTVSTPTNPGDIANSVTLSLPFSATAFAVTTSTTQPEATTIVTAGSINATLTFDVTLDGGATETLRYRWSTSNATGTSTTQISTTTNPSAGTATFTIPTDLTPGTYYYRCEALSSDIASPYVVFSNVATVIVQQNAGFNISYTHITDGAPTITGLDNPIIISRTGSVDSNPPQIYPINLPTPPTGVTYDFIEWTMLGISTPDATTFTLNASTLGVDTEGELTLIVEIDGEPFSKTIFFKVVE